MPVTTRRQSRGIAQPNAMEEDEKIRSSSANLREIDDDDDDDDDDPMGGPLGALSSSEVDDDGEDDSGDEHLSSLSEGEESDSSEFGKGMLHSLLRLCDVLRVCAPAATPQAPVAKRRKMERASPSKPKKSGPSRRVRGRLENMLSLPLDVLFVVSSRHRLLRLSYAYVSLQILSGLLPMDLLNLARTSKNLRQVLMSRKSMSVWISARRNAGATVVPEPPEDMSEPAWAQLLFGPPVCSVCSRLFLDHLSFQLTFRESQQCSTKNIHRVDFALRRRLCTVCRKRK